MDRDIKTLRFRTKWLHNTVKVMKNQCKNLSDDTRARIETMTANKTK